MLSVYESSIYGEDWARKDLIKEIVFDIEQCIGVCPGEEGGEEGKCLHDFLSKPLWKGVFHFGIRVVVV